MLEDTHWTCSLYILHHELGRPHTPVEATHHFEMLFLIEVGKFQELHQAPRSLVSAFLQRNANSRIEQVTREVRVPTIHMQDQEPNTAKTTSKRKDG